jgi:LmbE family N-acetylglucosaminyl deacetylase
MFGSRILLLAPHPDDEIAGCCAAIGRAQAQGANVAVAFLTTGIPARERLWPWERAGHPARVERRRQEARRVCGELGAEVTAFAEVASRRLKNEIEATRESILRWIATRQVDTLWVPAYEGGHPDHDVANFIASTFHNGLPVWEFSEYNFAGGRVHSNEFVRASGKETEIALSEGERRAKRKFLEMYESERANLSYLKVEREVFRPLAEYEYAKPPHDGTLFYGRYAWAAFHPRVNEVLPEEVSRAISDFQTRR